MVLAPDEFELDQSQRKLKWIQVKRVAKRNVSLHRLASPLGQGFILIDFFILLIPICRNNEEF